LFKAAFLLAFHGFFRVGELMVGPKGDQIHTVKIEIIMIDGQDSDLCYISHSLLGVEIISVVIVLNASSLSLFLFWINFFQNKGGCCDCDHMVVGFTTIYAISAYHHWCCEFESRSGRGVQHYDVMVPNFH
jgi:hypothetical protein